MSSIVFSAKWYIDVMILTASFSTKPTRLKTWNMCILQQHAHVLCLWLGNSPHVHTILFVMSAPDPRPFRGYGTGWWRQIKLKNVLLFFFSFGRVGGGHQSKIRKLTLWENLHILNRLDFERIIINLEGRWIFFNAERNSLKQLTKYHLQISSTM
jgi:hypothetical protein